MGCPGLHCPGCSGGQSLAILGGVVAALAVAYEALEWVRRDIWWISSTAAVCYALAIAASMWLYRWADHRGARFAAAHGIVSRADVMALNPARVVPEIRHAQTDFAPAAPAGLPRQQERPAVGPPPAVHIHFHGLPLAEQAAIIRQALPGQAGESITEGK